MTHPPRRKWLQFRLRSLFGLIVGCSIGLALWNVYVATFQHEHAAMALVADLGGEVATVAVPMGWAENSYFVNVSRIDLTLNPVTDADLASFRKLTKLGGLELSGTRIGDDGVAQLSDVHSLRFLNFRATRITDAGVAHLAALSNLEDLNLQATSISDSALPHLSGIPGLRRLNLNQTKVSDAGMAELRKLKALDSLHLGGTTVTDSGVQHLGDLTQLEQLGLANTDVTEVSLGVLRSLPQLEEIFLAGTQIIPAAYRRAFPHLANREVTQALQSDTYFPFEETTLQKILEYLSDDISIVLGGASLSELGISVDEPITANFGQSSLEDLLPKFLAPLGLKHVVRYESIVITRQEDHEPEATRMVIGAGQRISLDLSVRLYLNPVRSPGIESPWPQAVKDLSQNQNILLKIDETAFRDAGRPLDATVTIAESSSTRVSLGSWLEGVFDVYDVHGVIENDRIWIRPGLPQKPQPVVSDNSK